MTALVPVHSRSPRPFTRFRTDVSIAATCEECQRSFEPLSGGACARCKRLLCGRHLRGWRPAVFALFERARPECVRCRRAAARGEAPGVGPS